MKTNETMPGAARSDASANGPSVAEIVNGLASALQSMLTQTGQHAGWPGTIAYQGAVLALEKATGVPFESRVEAPPLCPALLSALAASAQQIGAPLIPVGTIEAAQGALDATRRWMGYTRFDPLQKLIDAAHAALAGAQPPAQPSRDVVLEEAAQAVEAMTVKGSDKASAMGLILLQSVAAGRVRALKSDPRLAVKEADQ